MASVTTTAYLVAILGAVFFFYTYFGYPASLWVLSQGKKEREKKTGVPPHGEWPKISIVVPVYNEGHQIEELIRNLLSLDYPPESRQILFVSDASTDRTDEIVSGFASEGVELVRMEERGGKTKAEERVTPLLSGEIIVNTDASIRFPPEALKNLLRPFSDPEVGLASGRDVSVGPGEDGVNVGESGYVGYEMGVRDLETRVSGIVGASGCFYAILPDLHRVPLPDYLSRDFAAALHTREGGYLGVSVSDAVCFVPRSTSLRQEYRRKVRTIARGMDTLSYKRSLLNPFRYGWFSWMLVSHKLCRWAVPWVGMAALAAVGFIALSQPWARGVLVGAALVALLAGVGWHLDGKGKVPRIFSIPAFLVLGNLAAAQAFVRLLRRERSPMWEPTRRESAMPG
jgi:cellulose synthase/poly-beta-1,6-N-acetylglucosamine synthase-like glycosyltransferase